MTRLFAQPKQTYLIGFLFLVALYFAFFWRLDGALLWRDEATTACWGREMSASMSVVPSVLVGDQLVVQGAKGHDFNSHFQPAMQGWLQFYVSAIGFTVLGVSTFAARAVFALIGVLGIGLIYLIFKQLFDHQKIALLASFLSLLSMPYLHYARQSRYYVLAMVIALALIYELIKLSQREELPLGIYLRIGLLGILLFLSNYFTFGILWMALFFSFLLFANNAIRVRLAGVWVGVIIVVMPMLVGIHGDFIARAEIGKLAYLIDYWYWFLQAYDRVNYLFPVIPFLILGAFLIWRYPEQTRPTFKLVIWLWVALVVTVCVSVLVNKSSAFLRYYLHVIPMAIVLTGIYAVWIFRIWNVGLAFLFVGFTLIYHNISPVLDHSQSILKRQFSQDRSFNGPMVGFLDENVKAGETVAFSQNDIGMVAYFYRPDIKWCAILEAMNPYNQPYKNRLSAEMFDNYYNIDWVIVWGQLGLPQRVVYGYELVWHYRFGLDVLKPSVAQKIYTPEQYTITQAEAGMSSDLRYFDFYRKKQSSQN